MSSRIPRLDLEQMDARLREALKPRIARLGYLGEFFKCAASQPDALLKFHELTDSLKKALPDNLTEIVALTVSVYTGNAYERNQHERLCVKLGFAPAWVRHIETLVPDRSGLLSSAEKAAQRLTLAALAMLSGAHRAPEETLDTPPPAPQAGAQLELLISEIGAEQAVAVLMLIGRYVSHAIFVTALGLEPPVPSIFEKGH